VTLGAAGRRRIREVARGRAAEGLRLLEGPKAIGDALDLGLVQEVWVGPGLDLGVREALAAAARARGVPVGQAAPRDFARLSRAVTGQEALALVRDPARPVEAVLDAPGLVLWLDGVQDPGNVGAIMRVAAAFGAAGVLVGEGTADPLGPKALRASAGLALRVPFARGAASAAGAALAARARAVWLLDAAGEDLFRLGDVPADLVLVIGGEGRGAGSVARAAAGRAIGIPLAAGVDSLNAAVAAGIALAGLGPTRR
jgi:TrmH family RNA methyltransferase